METTHAPTGQTRKIDIPGLYNLRDTGGYRVGDQTTRWGKLFRSDALHRLDSEGQERFTDIGIRHIIDLRSDNERATAPSLVGDNVKIHNLPVFSGAAPAAQAYDDVTLDTLYAYIVDERGDRLTEAIRTIAHSERDEAVLVHCTAGKDRTGLVVAISLAAVGVERDDVVRDYADTEQHLAGEWVDMMLERMELVDRPKQTILDIISASPADVMARVLERLDSSYGSPADYLIRNGLTARDLDRLTDALVS